MSEPENTSESPESNKENSGIQVSVFGRTDVGLVRDHNEDNFLVADLTAGNRSIKPEVREHIVGKQGSLFVVCDGMGGAAAGEVASKIGIDTIYELMQKGEPPKNNDELAKKLETSIIEAGMRILTAAKLNRAQRGMGTTVTAAVMNGPRLLVGQVGDSRAYVLRGEELVQVTKDQSLVQQLLDANQLTEEEARNFDKANIILQALGTTEDIHVDITTVDLRLGDTLVMCSDGLTGPVSDDLVRKTMLETDDLADVCKQLTDLACEGGGQDNITVIASRFEGEPLLEPNSNDVLEYEKYSFEGDGSDSAQTIPAPAKKAKTQKQKIEKKEPEVEKVEPVEVKRAPPKEIEKKSKTGLYAGVGVFLIVCVVLGGYFLLSGGAGEEPDESGQQIILDDPTSSSDPGHASTNSEPSETDTWDRDNEPVLAPTPEEAISGTGVDSDPKPGSAPDKPENSTNEDKPDNANPGGNKPTQSSGGSKPPSNQNQNNESESEEEDKPDEEPVVEPEPIDDNPF